MPSNENSFKDMARALHELGFTEQELANTELLAEQLVRSGWTRVDADMAVQRIRRRNETLSDAQHFFADAAKPNAHDVETLIRMLVKDDPPPWRAIATVVWSIVRSRLRSM